MPTLTIPCSTGQISDGYHTFDELYEHRCLLFLALMRAHPALAWRARAHEDGSQQEGWFVAGLNLPTGPISYHLPERLWPLLGDTTIQTHPCAPAWDGHTSRDVLSRLEAWLKGPGPS